MHRIILILWLSLLGAMAADKPITIRVIYSEGFGDALTQDIQKVLYSAADELLPYYPKGKPISILVERSKGSPIAKFRRGPNGEYLVGLDVDGRYWAQFAYQFAHELTHILSNYERVDSERNANQWFMESLCETASMFAVSRMAVTWKTNAPYPNWKNFASALQDYADRLKNNPERQIPRGTTLAAWFKINEPELRTNAVLRVKNAIVARQLLTLLEAHPEYWGAVRYLNLGEIQNAESFEKFLGRWARATPADLQPFVREIAKRFGINLQSN